MVRKRNILLVLKTGGRYSIPDVILLVEHLIRNSRDIKIYCLTDLVTEEVVFKDMTFLPLSYSYTGWWAKLELFAPELEYLRPFLYMDLDTLVNGNIEPVFPAFGDCFYTLEDFYQPKKLASGMMWLPAGNEKVKTIWNEWNKHPFQHMKKSRGDQEFMRKVIGKPDRFFSNKQAISFKPNKKWRLERPEVPIVCFHGEPSIFEAAAEKVTWVENYVKE